MNAIHKLANLCFVAPNGNDVPAVTADPMREAHRIAMEETGPNLYQMMENAHFLNWAIQNGAVSTESDTEWQALLARE